MRSNLPLILVLMLFVNVLSYGQVTVDNTLTAKQLVEDYLIGDGVEVLNVTINGQPEWTVNNQAGLYGGVSDFVDFTSGVLMVTANAKTVTNDCCTASASITSGLNTICQGEEITLEVNLSGGVDGQYVFTYSDGTQNYTVFNASDGHNLTVSPAENSTYTLISVSNGSCNGNVNGRFSVAVDGFNNAGDDVTLDFCADGSKLILTPGAGQPANGYFTPASIMLDSENSGDYFYISAGSKCEPDTAIYTVNIEDKLVVNAVASCGSTLTEYSVDVVITGGIPPYSINGTPIPGSTFLSSSIPIGENYNFIVDDSGSCDPVTISGIAPDCSCELTADFANANQTICTGSEAALFINLSGGDDGQYEFEYTNGTDNFTVSNAGNGQIITVSPIATTTYTLLSVSDGDCTATVNASVTITVEELPNAGDDVSTAYCGNGSTQVLMPAFDQPIGGDFNLPSITLNSGNSGTYLYTMQGNACPDDQASYTIQIDEPLTVNSVATCEPNYTHYTVEMAINGGSAPYFVNGTAISGSTFTSDMILIGTNYNYIVEDSGPCGQLTVSGNLPQQFSFPAPTNPISDDPDLMAIAGQVIRDAIIIEFDFLATSDSIKFNYVFASKEYPAYTCSDFNDAFGFFLSGAGISGSYSNNSKNIALIPDTEVPVAINTVNSGVPSGTNSADTCAAANPDWIEHSQYFVNSSGSPYNDVQFPGMTQTFTALSAVQCGEWYHIKLALGDALDANFDSGVFLEAGSFTAFGALTMTVEPQIGGSASSNPAYDSVLVAGCSEIYIELTKPNGVVTDSIWVEFGGTAILDEPDNPMLGADYTLGEADTLFFFPEGVDTIGFSIATIWDEIPDEEEFIVITLHYQNGCGDWKAVSDTIQMVDPYKLNSEVVEVTLTCPADQVLISAEGLDGIEPYFYDWGDYGSGNGLDEVHVDVMSLDSVYYQVAISDACAFERKLDSILVINNIPDPLQAVIDAFQDPQCPNEPVDLQASIMNGNGGYNIIWENGNGGTYLSQESITVSDINKTVLFMPDPVGFTEILPVYLTVIDTCNTIVRDTVFVNYPYIEPLKANFNFLKDHCPTDPILLTSHLENGHSNFLYNWSITKGSFGEGADPTSNQIHVVPAAGMNEYSLTVSDYCGRMGTDYQYIIGEGDLLRSGFSIYSDSLRVINLDKIMNVITPNGDNKNDYFVVEGIHEFDDARLEVYDRWGRMIYENSKYNAGLENPKPENVFDAHSFEDGTYFYIVNVQNGQCVQSGTIEVLRGTN